VNAVQNGRLDGRIALITGASRGIGRAISRRFAAEGAHVLLLSRTQGALEELDDEIRAAGGAATLIPADLSKLDSIDQIATAIHHRFGRLDILVANAGQLGVLGPLSHMESKVWSETLTVNVSANWRIIRAFDPLLHRSEAGRAIFVTSGVGRKPRAYWGAYAVSKAALDMLVSIYAKETAKSNLRVNLVNPGKIRTGMRAAAFPGEDPMSLKAPESLADLFVGLAEAGDTRHGEWIEVD
jgi:NAD(P)-dependent dehydrogenase (short-subunit alcohol dehydrogenase family)